MPHDSNAERNSAFCDRCMSHHSGACPPDISEVWKELGDLIIECDRERSRVKWLVAATEYPEHIIVAALKHGAHVKEIVYTEDGFWTMVAD